MVILRVTLKALHYVVVVQSPIVIWIIHPASTGTPFFYLLIQRHEESNVASLHFQFSRIIVSPGGRISPFETETSRPGEHEVTGTRSKHFC